MILCEQEEFSYLRRLVYMIGLPWILGQFHGFFQRDVLCLHEDPQVLDEVAVGALLVSKESLNCCFRILAEQSRNLHELGLV